MLTLADEKRLREIVKGETKELRKSVNRIDDNVDKILKIVTDDRQELTIAKARVDKHDKRLRKVEGKIKIKPSSPSAVFA